MLVLGIETATDVCAVGLVDGDRDLADLALLQPRGHGSKLAGLIAAALEAGNVEATDLDAVTVSSGPGSYTGLRIGVSTAKGLCLSTGAHLVSVPTLRALAEATPSGASLSPLLVSLPSRRGEVYAAVFEPDPTGWIERVAPAAVDLTDLAEWVPSSPSYAMAGPARDLVRGALSNQDSRPHLYDLPARPSGLVVARLGHGFAEAGHVVDVATFEPDYLKPFVSGGA